MARENLPVHAVILAGGRGTRFWPRSRTRTPKQLLNIVGKGTMLEQTVARLRPLVPAARIWTVTNAQQVSANCRGSIARRARTWPHGGAGNSADAARDRFRLYRADGYGDRLK